MHDEKLNQFNLVGGTALALYMGHRKSIDLDLFSQHDFNVNELEKHLADTYNYETDNPNKKSTATLIGRINGIKVDFICYEYLNVKPIYVSDGIRICSMYDIAAMKLTAIAQNGTRLKDFVDIAFLSTQMSLQEMIDVFGKKYPNTNKISAVKGLTYFNDIEFASKIELINGTFKWKGIEKRIHEMVKYPDKIFNLQPIAVNLKK
jgi:predicted nucleotidyltransferase component of viral defense system